MSFYQGEQPMSVFQESGSGDSTTSNTGYFGQSGAGIYSTSHGNAGRPEDVVDFLDSSKFFHGNGWQEKELPLGSQQDQENPIFIDTISTNPKEEKELSMNQVNVPTNQNDELPMNQVNVPTNQNGELPMNQVNVPTNQNDELPMNPVNVPTNQNGELPMNQVNVPTNQNDELPMNQVNVPTNQNDELPINEELPMGNDKTDDNQVKSCLVEPPQKVSASQPSQDVSLSEDPKNPSQIITTSPASSSSSSSSSLSNEGPKKTVSLSASTESSKSTKKAKGTNNNGLSSSSPASLPKTDKDPSSRDGDQSELDSSSILGSRMSMSQGDHLSNDRKSSSVIEHVDYSFYRPLCKYDEKCKDKGLAHHSLYLHSNFLVCVPAKEALVVLERYRKRLAYYKANIDTLMHMLNEVFLKKGIPQNNIDLSGLERFFFDQDNRDKCEFFLENILPSVIDCALNYFILLPPPLLFSPEGLNSNYTFTKKQALAILCNSFLCTYDDNLRTKFGLPPICMNTMYFREAHIEKIMFIINYFTIAFSRPETDEKIIFKRSCIKEGHKWPGDKSPICKAKITDKIIEDSDPSHIKVDFANKFLGGGVLSRGCVQEEIMFLEHPELIAGRLVFRAMGPLDCIVMIGPEQYSKSSGYSYSTRFNRAGKCTNIRDSKGVIQKEFVAIDAIKFKDNYAHQFKHEIIRRELNKAYCGFSCTYREGKSLATGHWGCGAFNGDKDLKCLIQILAASAAGYKNVLYTNMDDLEFEERFNKFMEVVHEAKLNVSQLHKVVLECCGPNIPSNPTRYNTKLLTFVTSYINIIYLKKDPL